MIERANLIGKKFKQKHKTLFQLFPQYRIITRVLNSVTKNLTPDKIEILTLKIGELEFDFTEQVILKFLRDRTYIRFPLKTSPNKLFAYAEEVMNKYYFLFSSELEHKQIREILVNEMCEAITHDMPTHHSHLNISDENLNNENFVYAQNFFKRIENAYPRLPKSYVRIGEKKKSNIKSCSFATDQLPALFQDFINKDTFATQQEEDDFFEKLLSRIKWYLEQLSNCNEVYEKKYRSQIIREVRHCIWSELDSKISKDKRFPRCYR